MARNHGRILSSAWAAGSDFRNLRRSEQGTYFFLLSQPGLTHAGGIQMSFRKWAGNAAEFTVDDLTHDLRELERKRYVVIDWDTEELLVRTLVRNDGVWKQPKVMLAMVAAVDEIESPKLRRALLVELDRLPLDELSDDPTPKGGPSVRAQIAECVRLVHKKVEVPGGGPDGDPSGRVSDIHTDTLPHTQEQGYPIPPTRAHAARRDARSPAPAPTPAPSPTPAAAAAGARGGGEAAGGVPAWAIPLVDQLAAEGFVVSWDLTFVQWDQIRVSIDRAGIPALIEYARRRNTSAKTPAYSAAAWVKGWFGLPALDSNAALAPVTHIRPPGESGVEPSRNARIIAAARERARAATAATTSEPTMRGETA